MIVEVVVGGVILLGIGVGVVLVSIDRCTGATHLTRLTQGMDAEVRANGARGRWHGLTFVVALASRSGGGGSVFRVRLAGLHIGGVVIVPAAGPLPDGHASAGQGGVSVVGVSLALLVGGVVLLGVATWFFTPLSPWPDTAWTLLPIGVALMAHAAWVLKRMRRALDALRLRFSVFIGGVPGVTCLVWAMIVTANGGLDFGPKLLIELPVLEKRVNQGRDDPYHRVVVPAPGRDGIHMFRGDPASWDAIEAGTDVHHLRVGGGLFGSAWEAGGAVAPRQR